MVSPNSGISEYWRNRIQSNILDKIKKPEPNWVEVVEDSPPEAIEVNAAV